MASLIEIRRFHKQVPIWSGRKKRNVLVEVDYESIKAGDFTLIHIARMRETPASDTPQQSGLRRFVD